MRQETFENLNFKDTEKNVCQTTKEEKLLHLMENFYTSFIEEDNQSKDHDDSLEHIYDIAKEGLDFLINEVLVDQEKQNPQHDHANSFARLDEPENDSETLQDFPQSSNIDKFAEFSSIYGLRAFESHYEEKEYLDAKSDKVYSEADEYPLANKIQTNPIDDAIPLYRLTEALPIGSEDGNRLISIKDEKTAYNLFLNQEQDAEQLWLGDDLLVAYDNTPIDASIKEKNIDESYSVEASSLGDIYYTTDNFTDILHLNL